MRALLFGILLSSVNLLFSQETGANRIEAGNEQLLYSTSSIDPKVQSFDKTKSVGQIPMEQGTANGALTYAVPIDVYPGRNGLTPKISISYNSMVQFSSMGKGWYLGGLSSINLVNNNLYYNSVTSPSELSFYDSSYVLDGIRLVRVTGESYDFQSETGLTRVKAILDASQIIKYFKVFRPDGSIAIYGFETNTAHQLTYPLTRITDEFGNTIEFTYHIRTNLYDIAEIKYGSNGNTPHYASLKFSYESSVIPDQYTSGLTLSSGQRVSKIETFFNNTLLRTYDITYQSYSTPLITRINCSSDGESLNPLQFYYGNNIDNGFEVKNFTTKLSVTGNIKDFRIDKGKFGYNSSNDGVVVYRNLNPYYTYSDACYTQKLAIGAIDNMPVVTIPNIDKAASEGIGFMGGKGFLGVMVADVDGDGVDELVQMNSDGNGNANNYSEKITYITYSVSGNTLAQRYKQTVSYNECVEHHANFNGTTPVGVPCRGLKAYCPAMRTHISGNFLGDNKTYILSVSSNKTHTGTGRNSKFTLFSPISGEVSYSQDNGGFDYLNDYLVAIDHDGDGKTDICHINPLTRRMNVYTFELSGSTVTLKTLASNYDLRQDYPYNYSGYAFTDLNNDGKTDIVGLPENKIHHVYFPYIVFYSKGKGAFARKRLDSSVNGDMEDFTGIQVSFQDVNRDGRADLVLCRQNKTMSVHLGKFTGYFDLEKSYKDVTLSKDIRLVPVNIQQPNYTSCLLAIENNNIFSLNSKSDDSKNALLNRSISSLGLVREHTYGNISQSDDGIYTVGVQEGGPYGNLQGNLSLIKQNVIKCNDNIIFSNTFKYIKGILDKRGKGFLGYEKIETTDNIRNTKTTQVFDPKNFGVLRSVDSPTMSSAYNYNVAIENNKIAKITLSDKTEKDKLKGLTKTIAYTYDTYGLPLTEVVDYGGNIKTTTCNWYNNYNTVTSYRLGVIKETNIKEERNSSYVTGRTVYEDFNSRYLPQTKKSYYKYKAGAEMQVSQESYMYDSQNNMVQRSISPYSSALSQTVSYTYDNLGRISGETDALGLKTSYIYNNTTGLLEKSTNHKGQNTTYSYDAWGRNIKETYPDGTRLSIKTQWVPPISSGIVTDTNIGADTHVHELSLSASGTLGGTVTACESISLKPGFSYNSANGGNLVLKIDPTIHADSPSQYTNAGTASYMITTEKTGTPLTQTYYDALGRVLRTGEMRFDGKYLYTDNIYDREGRIQKTSLPFRDASPSLWNTYQYDSYGRITRLSYASGKEDTYSYDGNSVTSVIDNVSTTKVYDASGETVKITDPSGTIKFYLRPDRQTERIVSPGGIVTDFEYDALGRQTAIVDASAGRKTYGYDTYGNINQETNADGSSVRYMYDIYGRMTEKEIAGEQTIRYDFDADGLLTGETGTNGTSKAYTYDAYFRLATEKESVTDGKWFQKTYTYSNNSLSSTAYSANTGSIVTENYAYSYGSLTGIKLNNAIPVWKLVSENNLGMATRAETGILSRSYTFDEYGHPVGRSIKNGSSLIQDFSYNFDTKTGNLNWRKDNSRNLQEDFVYDNLNRLTHFNGNVITYDVKGNITDHTGVGKFGYGREKPFAIETGSPYGGNIPMRNQQINYNAQMRPSSITENGYAADFTYNGDGDRVRMRIRKDNADELVRYYMGNQYEVETGVAGTKERLYLGGDAYTAAAVYIREGNGGWTVNFIGRDYLGSITHVISANGQLRQELSYDPWGRLRNPGNHELYAAGSEPVLLLGRGFTGHEHLTMFGLVNMNARLYDPVLGRFLSPDPYVQNPFFSQNYNRYSYGWNNPLRFTDPDGEWIHIAIGALAGGVFNVIVNWDNINNFGQGLSYFGMGAAGGAVMATGNIVAGGILMSGGNSILTQGFQNGFDNIDFNQVGMSATMGGITSYLGGQMGQYLQGPLSKLFSSVASPMLREGLTYGTNGALTGFTLGTGMAMAGGEELGDAMQIGGKSAIWGFGAGFGYGMYSGYKYAQANNLNPVNGKPNLRAEYEQSVKALKLIDAEMKSKGFSEEQRAIELNRMRRELGKIYKDLTHSDLLNQIYERNIQVYGDKYGPTIDYLRKVQGKSWDEIIKSSYTPGGKDINFKK